jgi:hypothetical protein
MQRAIEKFQVALAVNFRELLLGVAAFELGMQALDNNRKASISISIADGAHYEPIHVSDLFQNAASVKHGPIELFQSKCVAMWNDLTVDIFSAAVTEHLDGVVAQPDLGSYKIQVDLASSMPILEQIKTKLISDFAFTNHGDRLRSIGKIIPLKNVKHQIDLIRKHVEIRNSFQHHGGVLHAGALKILATKNIKVKDGVGKDVALSLGQKIELSVIEVDLLKSALFEVSSYMEVYIE